MKKIILTGLSVLFFGVVTQAATPALKVVSASPKGQQNEMGRQAVNIHFNQPVVALGEESQFSSENCPIHII